jgi:hypothetical protein
LVRIETCLSPDIHCPPNGDFEPERRHLYLQGEQGMPRKGQSSIQIIHHEPSTGFIRLGSYGAGAKGG